MNKSKLKTFWVNSDWKKKKTNKKEKDLKPNNPWFFKQRGHFRIMLIALGLFENILILEY